MEDKVKDLLKHKKTKKKKKSYEQRVGWGQGGGKGELYLSD